LKTKVRFAGKEDALQLVEWLHANRELNQYDPEILSYDSTRVLAVEMNDETIMYLPYQLTIMTDSLAPKPGLSKRKKAVGLREAIHGVVRIAKASHLGEIYFIGSDDETVEFAKQHGYEEVKGARLMRLKPRHMVPALPEEAAKEQQDQCSG
jgi:hypothetical protein